MTSYIKMQKVIKVGNSLAVTLDREFVKRTDLKVGDNVAAAYSPSKGVASLAKSKKSVSQTKDTDQQAYISSRITPELQAWVKKTLEEDKEAMEALKDL